MWMLNIDTGDLTTDYDGAGACFDVASLSLCHLVIASAVELTDC
jgi:hypothetical protein